MVKRYTDICADVESWGTRAGFDLRSIGAVVFDPLNNKVAGIREFYDFPKNHEELDPALYYYKAVNNPLMGSYSPDHFTQRELDKIDGPHRRYNLRRDPKTVDWWGDQEEDAKAAFKDPIDLKEGLLGFTQFIHSHSKDIQNGQAKDVRVWGHGAAFDPPFLEAVFHAVDLPVPWFYRAPRDTRTAFDLSGIEDHSAHLAEYQYGIKHHALHDTITEAFAINEAIDRLRYSSRDWPVC